MNTKNNSPRISAIILCAGLSSRMNQFKPLLSLSNGETFIQHLVNKLNNVCSQVVIVSGHNSEELNRHLIDIQNENDFEIVYNKNYKSGMFSSLQTGLVNRESDWYLYHFVDQPSLPNQFYEDFLRNLDNESNWIQPINEKGKGHPILFDSHVKDLIVRSDANSNLREVNKDSSIIKKYWECNSDSIFQDIDTPEDYNLI